MALRAAPLAIFLASCAVAAPASSATPLLRAEMPAFTRAAIDGRKVDTRSLRGRVVVVKFFARHCAPCRRTLPALERYAGEHPEVTVLGVSEDESQADAESVRSELGLTFPIVLDRDNVLSGRFRVADLPATFVVGAEGRVFWYGGPERTERELVDAIGAAPR